MNIAGTGRYYFTNFYRWQQPLITALRKKGFSVYHLRDAENGHFSIEERAYFNNIGFLVTDREILTAGTPISDARFYSLGLEEDVTLADTIRLTADEIADELSRSKAEYELSEKKSEESWKEVLKIQQNRLERDRHYNLSMRKDNPVICNGYGVRFQTIYDKGNGTQDVMFFIINPWGKIIVDSKTETFELNADYKMMAETILEKHVAA